MTQTNAGTAVIGLTTTATAVAAINEYATVISLALTALGLCIGLYFHLAERRYKRRQEKDQLAVLRQQIRAEMKAELTKPYSTEQPECEVCNPPSKGLVNINQPIS